MAAELKPIRDKRYIGAELGSAGETSRYERHGGSATQIGRNGKITAWKPSTGCSIPTPPHAGNRCVI